MDVANDTSSYVVEQEAFSGPLGLLLALIEKRKLHISDISLAQVSDDFVKFIESSEHFPVEQTADFLLVASTLLLIKSKSLLPTLDLTTEEEDSAEDLERRLKLYQKIKSQAKVVQTQFGQMVLFQRSWTPPKEVVFSPHKKITTENMHAAVLRAIDQIPKKEVLPETKVQKVISIEEMVDHLSDRITKNINMSFREFAGDKEEKVTVIVGFLAMLELVKQGVINARQEAKFSDIMMESGHVDTPRYS